MNKEALAYRFIKNTLFILLIGSGPILDLNNTSRALRAMTGAKVDCSSGEPADRFHNFDVIAVYGAGTDGEQPGTFQKGRLDAAAAAFVENLATKIVLLDGGGQQAVEMSLNYLQAKVAEFSGGKRTLKKSSVHEIPGSINTASNTRDLEEYMESNGLKKALGITDNFHSPRVAVLDCNYGANSQIMTVEEFAPEYYPYNIPDINARNRSLEMQFTRVGEELKIASLIWDPLALLSTGVKSAMINARDK